MKLFAKNHFNLIAILFILCLASCTEEGGPCKTTNTYHTLSAEQLNQTPYFTNPLFDTVSFASNTGDTLTFALQKIDTTWLIKDINTNPHKECGEYYHHQTITAKYKTIKGSGAFEVSMFYESLGLSQYAYPYLSIKFNGFKVGLDLDYTIDIKQTEFNGHTYFDLALVDNRPSYRLYLNQTHGLVRIGFNNDAQVWTLIQ